MRTALILLFLLAAAAAPGSLFPQRGVDPAAVAGYVAAHRRLGPWLDRVSMFDVYASAWFGAVYLLLVVSLLGCVVPRTVRHVRAVRRPPPPAPARVDRLPLSRTWHTRAAPQQVLEQAAQLLRRRGYRVEVDAPPAGGAADALVSGLGACRGEGAVRAEKGMLRESGNLAFHLALLGVLAGLLVTALFGVRGQALIVEGGTFADQPTDYDILTPGRLADVTGLPPFTVRLDRFTATYQTGGPQTGTPTSFRADLSVRDSPQAPARRVTTQVNQPLTVAGTRMFLTGHGYAPVLTIRDGTGRVVFDGATVFLPQDGTLTSTGVLKIPDARPGQLGLSAILLPTAPRDRARGPVSAYPAALDPRLLLTGFTGDLGLDTGVPQSVYTLDTRRLTQLRTSAGTAWTVALRPGQTSTLPGGRGSITFTGLREYAVFKVARDPGRPIVAGAALLVLLGIIAGLGIRQRRVFIRARPTGADTRVDVGALPRNRAISTRSEFDDLVMSLARADTETHNMVDGAGLPGT